jgi:hypothetical protein
VVQEKYRGVAIDGVWKIPTGFIQEVTIYSRLSMILLYMTRVAVTEAAVFLAV